MLISKRLWAKYGFRPGVKVVIEEMAEGVLIKPMNEQYFKSFAGILKRGNLAIDMKKMKEEEKALEEKKLHSNSFKK